MSSARREVIARGRLRNAWEVLALMPLVATVVGVLAGVGVVISGSAHTFPAGVVAVASMAAGFAAVGGCASLLTMGYWLLSPARVRYVREGQTFTVLRGHEVVGAFDLSSVDSVVLAGGTTTREMLLGVGATPGLWAQLPHLWWTVPSDDGPPVSHMLPGVLIVGRSDTDALARRLEEALPRIRVERSP